MKKNNIVNRDVAECILINEKGEILLQKKTLDYKYGPGKWGLFGGEVEPGEDPKRTIKREIKEELNKDLKKFKLFKIKKYAFLNQLVKGKEYCFVASFKGNVSQISISEGAGFAFFSFSEIEKLNIHKMGYDIIKDYIDSKN